MKMLKTLIAVCILAVTTGYTGEPNEADQKWSEAVEKMIAAGPATISTPQASRAKLAQELAAKLGRESKIVQTEKGYRIVVSAAGNKNGNTAKTGGQ